MNQLLKQTRTYRGIRNNEQNEYWYIVLPIKEMPHIVMRLPHMILRGYALVRLFTSTAVIRRLG